MLSGELTNRWKELQQLLLRQSGAERHFSEEMSLQIMAGLSVPEKIYLMN